MKQVRIFRIVVGIMFFFCFCTLATGILFSNPKSSNAVNVISRVLRLPGQSYCYESSLRKSTSSDVDTIHQVVVNAELNQDGSFTIDEKIQIYLNDGKHGIYRYIPTLTEGVFSENGQISYYVARANIDNLQVYRENANDPVIYRTQTSEICNKSGISAAQTFEYARIGDEDATLSKGLYTYHVKYLVQDGLVKTPTGNTALYWNFWGNKWNAYVQEYTLNLSTPKNLNLSESNCYTGLYGETGSQNCDIQTLGNTISYNVDDLKPYEGVTILANFIEDSGSSALAANVGKKLENSPNTIFQLIIDILVICTSFLPIAVSSLIHKLTSSKASDNVIVPEYTPPSDLSPAQAGVMVDESAGKSDLAAIIISLCVKGWMKIKEDKGPFGIGKSYSFMSIPDTSVESSAKSKIPLSLEEESLYYYIFNSKQNHQIGNFINQIIDSTRQLDTVHTNIQEVKLNDLKYTDFPQMYQTLHSSLYSWAISKGYFKESPSLLFQKFGVGFAILISVITNFFIPNIISVIVLIPSAIFAIYLLNKISVVTEVGKRIQEKVKGFKMYLGTAEKNQIEFLNDPNKHDIETFEKYLPYAMALGVTKIWTDKFQDTFTEPPTWYIGTNLINFSAFNATDFTTALSDSLSTISSTVSSSTGNGGGGFSGGGGGGGGGGSW